MKKIFYIGYYSDLTKKGNRATAPSADTKMSYIIDTLKNIGYDVEVLSFCLENDRSKILKKYNGYTTNINNTKVKYFTTYASKYKILRYIGRIFTWIEQKKYIKDNCLFNKSNVIIYHSLSFFKLYKYLNKFKKKYITEVEEIYSDVLQRKKLRMREIKYLQLSNRYIFITKLLNDIINLENKPYVITHGTYTEEKNMEKINFDRNKMHCVYAGTFDPRKGGVFAAINAAKYLPSKYHIHILGFGTQKEIETVKNQITKISQKSKAFITYDGLLTGSEYIKFIQSCDIGLSTQNPNEAFNMTSFPSKILSYMSNGLRVVSVKIPAIETSDVGKYIYYYEKQTPKDIANAIMKIDLKDNYNSRLLLNDLDKKFKEEIKNILENKN